MDQGEQVLLPLLSGWYYSWALSVTARFGIADELAEGPLSAEELAERCGADPDSMRRLLEALLALGVLEPRPPGRFAEAPALRFLRRDYPGTRRASAILGGEPAFQAAWAHLAEAVRTGRSGFELAHGTTFFEFFDEHPELLDLFQQSMAGGPVWNEALPEAFDFVESRRVIDIGGGDGSQLLTLLELHPAIEGVVLERSRVLELLGDRTQRHPRLTYVAGDFLDGVPQGGDVYILRFVLHDWPTEHAITILRQCREAMAEGGRVLVLEHLRDARHTNPTALFDLTMMALTGGRVRTVEEHAANFEAAGLELVDSKPTKIGARLLVAAAG